MPYRIVTDTPNGQRRPRRRYLAGWRITSGPIWIGQQTAPSVLRLTPSEARACVRELAREQIAARIEKENNQ